MSEFERLSKNSIYSFLTIFFRLFSNVILFWLIARFYGKEIFGQFTIAQTFASVFVLFADFGLDILLTTELPRNIKNSTNIFQRLFSIKFLLSLVAFLGILMLLFFSNYNFQTKQLIIIFSFYAAFYTISNFLFALFKGYEKLLFETKVAFFVNLTSLIVILILIIFKQDIIIITLSFTIIRLAGLFLAVYFAYKILPSITFRLNFSHSKEIIHQVIVFGLFLVFGNLYFQLDTILLSFFKDSDSVGIYQAVFRLVMLPLIIPEILINSTLPTLSRLNSSDKLKWEKLGFMLNKFLIIISIPISVVLFFFAPQIINVVYGESEYFQAIPILKIFALIVFVRFFSEAYGLMLTTSNKQKIRMYVVMSATFLNLILNVMLIPTFGTFGAAMVALITNIFVAISFLLTTKSIIEKWNINIFKPHLLFAASVLILLILIFTCLNIWYLSILPLIFYFYYIYFYFLSDSDKKYISDIKNMLRKRI
jgi:O-antigen/teichoic acid export membrane protein